MINFTVPQEEYGFKADINRYVSASALEELTTCLSEVAQRTTYDGAIDELIKLRDAVAWHIDNLENNEEPRPCHKDGAAYQKRFGE